MRGKVTLVLLLAVAPACPGPVADQQQGAGFVDRTDFAGLDFENHTGKKTAKDYIVEAKGGGALVLDYDRDGDMDFYVIDGNEYEVDGRGNVRSRTAHPEARNRLLRNEGDWRFTDVTEAAGVGDRNPLGLRHVNRKPGVLAQSPPGGDEFKLSWVAQSG